LDPLVRASVSAFRQLDRRAQVAVLIVLAIAGLIAAVVYYQRTHPRATGPTATTQQPQGGPQAAPTGGTTAALSPNLLLGNPSGATADPSNRSNYLMIKPYYALSYNDGAGTPNWVSWRVVSSDLGDAPRKRLFDPDNTLPPTFKVVTQRDYTGSGFDRGHMCPHSDRAATQEMSYATFVMTNIIPQAPNVNQKAWAQLEMYCRDLVRRRNHLYVIAGPNGRGGRGSNGSAESLAGGKVTVPAECWKVIVVVPESGPASDDDLSKLTPRNRVIAVVMPNDNDAVGEEWATFRTTAAEIERRTGFHFFDRVPAEVATALRQKVDGAAVAPPTPMNHSAD